MDTETMLLIVVCIGLVVSTAFNLYCLRRQQNWNMLFGRRLKHLERELEGEEVAERWEKPELEQATPIGLVDLDETLHRKRKRGELLQRSDADMSS